MISNEQWNEIKKRETTQKVDGLMVDMKRTLTSCEEMCNIMLDFNNRISACVRVCGSSCMKS